MALRIAGENPFNDDGGHGSRCRREKNNPFSLLGEGQEKGINIQAVFYFDTLSPTLSQEGEGVTGTAVTQSPLVPFVTLNLLTDLCGLIVLRELYSP